MRKKLRNFRQTDFMFIHRYWINFLDKEFRNFPEDFSLKSLKKIPKWWTACSQSVNHGKGLSSDLQITLFWSDTLEGNRSWHRGKVLHNSPLCGLLKFQIASSFSFHMPFCVFNQPSRCYLIDMYQFFLIWLMGIESFTTSSITSRSSKISILHERKFM